MDLYLQHKNLSDPNICFIKLCVHPNSCNLNVKLHLTEETFVL
jgi:hypothetical protein